MLRITFDRYYLGLHGLGLMRSYPFGDPGEAEERQAAMRALLAGEGEPWVFEPVQVRDLDVREAYERWASGYDEPNPAIELEDRVLSEHLPKGPPGRAVDVATGTGRVASRLVRDGHSVVACDLSEAMLERARRKLDRVSLFVADLRQMPIRDESVDLVTCSLALTHVPDLGSGLRSFARILRPGGWAIVSDIHPYAVLTGAHAFFRLPDDSRAVTRNIEHQVSEYVTAALAVGLEIRRCTEGLVDEDLLRGFGVGDDPTDPERTLLGLPFILVWSFQKSKAWTQAG